MTRTSSYLHTAADPVPEPEYNPEPEPAENPELPSEIPPVTDPAMQSDLRFRGDATMQAQIIPFPKPAARAEANIRKVSIDGEYFEDDLPPVLFDADEDGEELAQELGMYVQIADHWND